MVIGSEDFAQTAGQYEAPVHAFRAPSVGTIAVVLRAANNEIMAEGSQTVTLERNWTYGATVWVARPDPRLLPWVICVPSVRGIAVAAPYRAALGDSIFVSWSGLPRGAVC